MAEVQIERRIVIKAETIGDVAAWLRAVEDQKASTPLDEIAYLAVTLSSESGERRG